MTLAGRSGTVAPGRADQGLQARFVDIRLINTQPMAVSDHVPRPARTVYVLRRHRRHLLVGRLLGQSRRALSDHRAKIWATRQAGGGTTSLLPWKLLDDADPAGGWHTTSSLLVEQYALYRHPGGWNLLGAVTRVPRSRIADDDDVKAWTADALHTPAPLSWDRGPVTQTTTTWYAMP
ncbi:hypothetical protein ACTMTI_39855 [Nonomuraea sp. H19]|uniref:hypothetical protein n=1 Tax=Nonomuraea sp. H19 TaxID=3452206 RepID=UPI003F8C1A03